MKMLMAENQRKAILETLPPNKTMLEWGSGGSTIWFLENMLDNQTLISIEHDPMWAEKVKQTAEKINYKCKWHLIVPQIDQKIIDHHRKFNATIHEELPVGLENYFYPNTCAA